jgi:hypothetical protein
MQQGLAVCKDEATATSRVSDGRVSDLVGTLQQCQEGIEKALQ